MKEKMDWREIVDKLIEIASNVGYYIDFGCPFNISDYELTDKGFKIFLSPAGFKFISLYESHGLYFFEGEDCYGRFRGMAVSQKEAKEIYNEVIDFLLSEEYFKK